MSAYAEDGLDQGDVLGQFVPGRVEILPAVPLTVVHSESVGKIAAALAAAQGAFPPIPRSKTVRIQTRTGGAYSFAYAPLNEILDAVRAPLAENELAIIQPIVTGGILVTLLVHSSGEWLRSEIEIPHPEDDGPKELGSAITYMRRYSLTALLGVASEEDDDGSAAQGDTVTERRERGSGTRPTTEAGRDIPGSWADLWRNFDSIGCPDGLPKSILQNGAALVWSITEIKKYGDLGDHQGEAFQLAVKARDLLLERGFGEGVMPPPDGTAIAQAFRDAWPALSEAVAASETGEGGQTAIGTGEPPEAGSDDGTGRDDQPEPEPEPAPAEEPSDA